ncbi:MAG: hypothetical protein ACKO42_04625 [Gammaproteobacteria bacterium]
MNTKSFLMLIRREAWEHRSLVWVPAITAALIVLAALISTNISGSIQINVDGQESFFFKALAADVKTQANLLSIWTSAIGLPVIFITSIVLYFYLIDSLYAERKDRSILFWKSMPVSDAATVLSKAATALIAVPIWIWLMSVVMGLLTFAIVALKVSGTPLAPLANFHVGAWFVTQLTLLQNFFIAALWYSPLVGWLLLVSVWAKRAPFLWAISPGFIAIFEELFFDTEYVSRLISYRVTHYFEVTAVRVNIEDGAGVETIIDTIQNTYSRLSAAPLLGELHLYTGVLAAAVLLLAAIRLRRWRDDT